MVKQSLTPKQKEWRERATLHVAKMMKRQNHLKAQPRIRIVCTPSETCIKIPGKKTVVRKPSTKERLAKKMWELHRKNHFRSRITNFNPRGPCY